MARRTLLALFVLPGLASCSFLLDFDSLQAGTGGGAGASAAAGRGGSASAGTSGTGGSSSGESGTGGTSSTACPDDCFHDDPCLVSGCNSDGSCKGGSVVGLAPDGIDETITADTHVRVTMIGASDAFYLSSFAVTDGKPEVTFYRLGGTEPDLTEIGTLGGLNIGNNADPASAAGLSEQPVTGIVHAFVAMNDRAGAGARVWHVLLNATDAPKPMPIGVPMDRYWTGSAVNYPVVLQTGQQPVVGWINPDQTVSLSDGSTSSPKVLATGKAATTLSLLDAPDGTPYALYTVAGGGVFVERPDLAPLEISECQPAPGDYVTSSTVFTNIPGFWIGGWTKFADGYLTTTGRAILCTPDGCNADTTACDGNYENNLVRNTATIVVQRPGAAAGKMELVQALSALSPSPDGDQVDAVLVLTQQSLTFDAQNPLGKDPILEDIADAITLASAPTTEALGFRGPDFPAVAFVEPDRFAVAWTQPGSAGGADELRVQRYKMCLP